MTKQRTGLMISAAVAIAVGGAVFGGLKGLPVAASGCTTSFSHGWNNSSVVYNGQVHVFHYNETCLSLEHSWFDGTKWHSEFLDGPASGYAGHTGDRVGEDNAALVYNGQLNDFYYNSTGQSLRHAWWDGSKWHFEGLDGFGSTYVGHTNAEVGFSNSVLIYKGQIQIFTDMYASGDHLRHDWWNGSNWQFQSLDGSNVPNATLNGRVNDNVGDYSSAVADASGGLHDFYYDSSTQRLRHAIWNGGSWSFEDLDGFSTTNGRTFDDVGEYNSAILFNGEVQDFYYNSDGESLRHTWWTGTQWGFETLDGSGGTSAGAISEDVGVDGSAVIWNGQLQDFSYDNDTGSLRHAWFDGATWHSETLNGTGSGYPGHSTDAVGWDNSALVYNGQLQDYYGDDNGSSTHLGEAWLNPPVSWGFTQI